MSTPPRWHRDAACRTAADPEIFFPEHGGSAHAAAAKKICDSCPVRTPCAHAGMSHGSGVWGGMSEDERRAARSTRATATR